LKKWFGGGVIDKTHFLHTSWEGAWKYGPHFPKAMATKYPGVSVGDANANGI